MTDSEKLDLLIAKMQDMHSEIGILRSDVTDLKSDVTTLKSDVTDLKSDVTTLKSEMQDTKEHIVSIEAHLENVVDKNIQIIAEGHLDLVRKLTDALKAENERELLLVRMNYFEDEVKRIREKLAHIA